VIATAAPTTTTAAVRVMTVVNLLDMPTPVAFEAALAVRQPSDATTTGFVGPGSEPARCHPKRSGGAFWGVRKGCR
jgi:hypothetical protein